MTSPQNTHAPDGGWEKKVRQLIGEAWKNYAIRVNADDKELEVIKRLIDISAIGIGQIIRTQILLAEERGAEQCIALLESAHCPDPDCDNNGTIAVRISDDEWEPQQCQWCDEKRQLLSARPQTNK